MRQTLAMSHRVVSKLKELEDRIAGHDASIQDILEAVRELTAPAPATSRKIGFELPPPAQRGR